MGILNHFGFRLSDEQKRAKLKAKYEEHLAKTKKVVKQLYKDGINENCASIKQIVQHVATAETEASNGRFTAAIAELVAARKLKDTAKNAIKQQTAFADKLSEIREQVSLFHYVAAESELSLIETLNTMLDVVDDLVEAANYDGAQTEYDDVVRRLAEANENNTQARREYVCRRARATAGLKMLKVAGFDPVNSGECIRLTGMIDNAKAEADKLNWEEAAELLADVDDVLSYENVKEKTQAARTSLATGTFMQDASEEEWATAVIDLFNLGPSLEKGDLHDIDVPIQIGPSDFKKYHKLQTMIAASGLEEHHRPTINLTVKGKKAPDSSFGIIGGTGPLSDAEMLEKTMENLINEGFDLDAVHIRLLSAPPPRSESEGFSPKKMARYGRRQIAFGREPHSKMALASNTAHMNIGKARKSRTLAGGGRRDAAGDGATHQVQDLSARVVESCRTDERLGDRPCKPLIMGTKAAFDEGDNGMYGKKFQDADVDAANVDPKDSITLQKWIDEAKRGNTTPELTNKLKAFIKSELARQEGTTHIVLGCTELPLALGGHTAIHEFEEELHDEGFDVYFLDTEDFFAKEYTKMVKQNAPDAVITPPKTSEELDDEAYAEQVEDELEDDAYAQQVLEELSLPSSDRVIHAEIAYNLITDELSRLPGKGKSPLDEDAVSMAAEAICDCLDGTNASDLTELFDQLGLGDDAIRDVLEAAYASIQHMYSTV